MWNDRTDVFLLVAMIAWLTLGVLRNQGVLGVRRGAALPRRRASVDTRPGGGTRTR